MGDREFSDAIKYSVLMENSKKNNNHIVCEECKRIIGLDEVHFDHIKPYSKGGPSTRANCRVLCKDCNLQKSNKEFEEYQEELRIRALIKGEPIPETEEESIHKANTSKDITKEVFDQKIRNFIDVHKDIKSIDFSRPKNDLPSMTYVRKYYDNLTKLKQHFGVEDLSRNWTKKTIKEAIDRYIQDNGRVRYEDLKSANKLPSITCITKVFPQYKTFNEFMEGEYNTGKISWNRDSAIAAGKKYVSEHGKITQKDLCPANGLPSAATINRLFGSLSNYQTETGSVVTSKNEAVTKDDIRSELDKYFTGTNRNIDSINAFYSSSFKYSPSTINRLYGNFEKFCLEEGITVATIKKARYTKDEIDEIIKKWVIDGKDIPNVKDFAKEGLPSTGSILKYYEDWREPFEFFRNVYETLKQK